eukprot:gene10114-8015_t
MPSLENRPRNQPQRGLALSVRYQLHAPLPGIPKFYRWLSERYPLLNMKITATEAAPDIDNLYLDMNGIIHNCTHANQTEVKLTEEEMILKSFNYMDKLIQIVKPKQLIFMAIDGVAPRAKMNQQRSRRFKSAEERIKLENEKRAKGEFVPDDPFDSNCITPGTAFMNRLGAHIRFFIRKKKAEDPLWQTPTVIFSGHDVPGEGEHKIMEYIRLEKKKPGLLREYFYLEFAEIKLPWELDGERVVDDFVLFCMLIGNDFLPPLPTLDINEGALNKLIDLFKALLPELGGHLTYAGELDRGRLEKLLSKLGELEQETLEERAADAEFMEKKRAKRDGGGRGRGDGGGGRGDGGGRGGGRGGGAPRAPSARAAVPPPASGQGGFSNGFAQLAESTPETSGVESSGLEEGEAKPPVAQQQPTMMSREARDMMMKFRSTLPHLPLGEKGFTPTLTPGTTISVSMQMIAVNISVSMQMIAVNISVSTRMIAVNVLGTPSRKESVVIAIQDLQKAQGEEGVRLGAALVAPSLLGQRCYVNWPYLQEGVCLGAALVAPTLIGQRCYINWPYLQHPYYATITKLPDCKEAVTTELVKPKTHKLGYQDAG